MKEIQKDIFKIFPSLGVNRKKGQNGVIGVIGGSYEYTGAPFYAAISALKMGADMVHVFCSKSAAGPIKTYSPQIIVHPLFVTTDEIEKKLTQQEIEFNQNKWVQKLSQFYARIDCWVIGPGLGRDSLVKGFFYKVICSLPQKTLVILDADGLYFTCQFPQLFPRICQLVAIMTPNHRQFIHLNKIFNFSEEQPDLDKAFNQKSIVAIEGKQNTEITVIKKGKIDRIMTPKSTYIICNEGSSKRCGGIGDILAGCVAACSVWDRQYGPCLGCYITRQASREGYLKEGRSLTAPNIISQLKDVIKRAEEKKENQRQGLKKGSL